MTRAAYLLTDMDKEYEAVFRFGIETDTLDTEGTVVAEAPIPEFRVIRKASEYFSGLITQIPPVYSAIKIDGKRAYSQARKGLEVEIPERTVNIYAFEIIDWTAPDLTVKIRCSKGTYIRSIARDLGIRAGSRAFCLALRRSGIGPFSVEYAVLPDSVNERDGMNPVDFAKAAGIPVLQLPIDVADRLRGGYPTEQLVPGLDLKNEATLCIDSNGMPAALMQLSAGKTSYRIVFD